MKTIVLATGSRHARAAVHGEIIRGALIWTTRARAADVNPDWELWDGQAKGVDTIAYDLAANDFGWRTRRFPADWPTCDPDWVDPLGLYEKCTPEHRRAYRNGKPGDYCPLAGFRRNQLMVDTLVAVTAEERIRKVCVGFPMPKVGSNGTADCVFRAFKAGLPVVGVPLQPTEDQMLS